MSQIVYNTNTCSQNAIYIKIGLFIKQCNSKCQHIPLETSPTTPFGILNSISKYSLTLHNSLTNPL